MIVKKAARQATVGIRAATARIEATSRTIWAGTKDTGPIHGRESRQGMGVAEIADSTGIMPMSAENFRIKDQKDITIPGEAEVRKQDIRDRRTQCSCRRMRHERCHKPNKIRGKMVTQGMGIFNKSLWNQPAP